MLVYMQMCQPSHWGLSPPTADTGTGLEVLMSSGSANTFLVLDYVNMEWLPVGSGGSNTCPTLEDGVKWNFSHLSRVKGVLVLGGRFNIGSVLELC